MLPGPAGRRPKLLTQREYWELESLVRLMGLGVDDLLGNDLNEFVDDVRLQIDAVRLRQLLERGFQLATALDRWQRRGIWVLGHEDKGFPGEITHRLGNAAPPVLYGIGPIEKLRVSGLAIVGSRDASADELEFARVVANEAASAGAPVVSGGARGVDAAAMRAALRARGDVVGILPKHLDRAVLAKGNREYISQGQLLLISPYDPAAGFNVGNAMGRNKLIYAFARAGLIASASQGHGGTWQGATEQLRRDPNYPLYVRVDDGDIARKSLQDRGALPWKSVDDVRDQIAERSDSRTWQELTTKRSLDGDPLFEFAIEMLSETSGELSRPRLLRYLRITPSQLEVWIPRFIQDGVLEKTGSERQVRYRVATESTPTGATLDCQEPDVGRIPGHDRLFEFAIDLVLRLNCNLSTLQLQKYLAITPGQLRVWSPRFLSEGALLKTAEGDRVQYRPIHDVVFEQTVFDYEHQDYLS